MKILIIGSGGREHSLAWRCKIDNVENEIFIAPGNAGTGLVGTNLDLNPRNFQSIKEFCINEKIQLVIVGSEEFLSIGLVDYLESFGIITFGPNQEAAKIESDKSFAKSFMIRNNIPTAAYRVFIKENYPEVIDYLKHSDFPVVIKVSGLAAGKGVIINHTLEEAKETISKIFIDNKFGIAGEKIVIEKFLEGEELSVLIVTDGQRYKILPTAQDHKRIYDNDLGKNTGGMGAYSPAPIANNIVMQKIEEKIIIPTLKGFREEKISYKGCLYFGLMIDKDFNPIVIEYNSRFGDPETQAILPLIEGDFSIFLYSASIGSLESNLISTTNSCSICVILSSAGYPDEYEKGKEIFGLNEVESINNCYVFHSGTKKQDGQIVTNGGRVLGITKLDRTNNLINCKRAAYDAIHKIYFGGIHFRNDIADKGIKHLLK